MNSKTFLNEYTVREEDQILKITETERNLEQFRSAKNTLKEYSGCIDSLFNHIVSLVQRYNSYKEIENLKFIKRLLPLPNDEVRLSYGRKLGYIQSILHFFAHAAQHFIKLTIQGNRTRQLLETRLIQLAETDMEFLIVGQLESFDING